MNNRGGIVQQRHPWQLWQYNMGRVICSSGGSGKASEFFRGSLELCVSGTLGPAVQVMGLLPLSGLWRTGEIPGTKIDSARQKICESAEALNPDYFRVLSGESDFAVTLEKIWTRPQDLFPFTYR